MAISMALAAGAAGCGTLLDTNFSSLEPEDGGSPSAPPACGAGVPSCVAGGILSVGRAFATPTPLPDGGTAAVVDDGFERGGETCDPSGAMCVTGAITP